jgi:glutathione S-transferase
MFPKVRTIMRKHMKIDADSAAQSQQRVEAALQRISDTVQHQPFLAGDQFSRADLTAAALLAPLFMPPQYGLTWPASLPEPLQSDAARYRDQLAWAEAIYQRYR